MESISKDLNDEYEDLDAIVADLGHEGWLTKTPFFGWTVKETISHLAFFDRAARVSLSGREAFDAHVLELMKLGNSVDEIFDRANDEGLSLSDSGLLDWWRRERRELVVRYAELSPGVKLPWYGPPMNARSSATARLMETWAHGQDIADALKMARPATARLKHIVHLGFSTFSWSFMNRGLAVPAAKPALVLQGPDGESWNYGTANAENRVSGTALDFCLVVTQRRHVNDTGLSVEGEIAKSWLAIAQAFAGPPQDPPGPGIRVWG